MPRSADISLSDTLSQYVRKWSERKILVVGDVMLDRFVYGSVSRISPESPVPVLVVGRENKMLGGAGNALNNLAHLEIGARVVAVCGKDDNAQILSEVLDGITLDARHMIGLDGRLTTVKTRYLAGHQQLLRTDYESVDALGDAAQDDIIKHALAAMDGVQCVVLSDYAKGVLTPRVVKSVIDAAQNKDIPVIIDPKAKDYSIYKGANAITPNKKELSEATGGMPVKTDEQVVAAARALISSSGVQAVIATRSGDGISVIHANNQDVTHFRGADIEVFDVSGAGDTVIATIASVVAAGGSLEHAAALANIAGGIVVAKVGTAPIRRDELLDALADGEADGAQRDHAARSESVQVLGAVPVSDMAERVKRWKARGLKVGFTNGCFDIVHAGHVGYLAEARARCDRLVVGLNSDSSVSILKGPERPVHDEGSRAAVLSALASVDGVVLFGARKDGDDNTATGLIEAIQPDIYFKGGDYTPEEIPETPSVRSYGGEVCVMSVFEGHSTTNSIAKIKSA